MTYADNIESHEIEKHTLIVVHPRIRVTNWTNVSGSIWKSPFSFGVVSRVWSTYNNDNGLTQGSSSSVGSGEFYHDYYTNELFVFSSTDPDSDTFPGRTVEFKLNLSDKQFTGPCDPLDSSSQVVEWRAVLGTVPFSQNGSRDNAYGFVPMVDGAISISNHEGWMNPFLHEGSFTFGVVKGYILASNELDTSLTKQIFFGYTSGLRYSGEKVSITTTDAIRFFDRQFTNRKITEISGYVLDPATTSAGQEYKIRKLYGAHSSIQPINIEYTEAFGTNNNRYWLTHDRAKSLDGLTYLSPGTVSYTVDHLAANTSTRTYTTTQPKIQVDDTVQMTRSAVNKYVKVTAVGPDYFDHETVTGSAASGDTVIRYFVGNLYVEFTPGDVHLLYAGLHYGVFTDATNNIHGIQLGNNFEGVYFATTAINPAVAKFSARVYGHTTLDQYSDSTDVAATVTNGGIVAKSVAMIYRFLIESGFSADDIDEQSFKDATADSFSTGVLIPDQWNGNPPTYREVITKLLSGNLYRLAFSEVGNALKLSLVEIEPLPVTTDYEADDTNFGSFEYEHDYGDIYSTVNVTVDKREFPLSGQGGSESVTYDSSIAANLHFKSSIFNVDSYMYDGTEAQAVADRYGFILGDRRGFYTLRFGLEYLDKSNLNSSYTISREKLPGFEYLEGTLNSRKMVVVETTKSSNGVKLTLEDQRGIEENAGSW